MEVLESQLSAGQAGNAMARVMQSLTAPAAEDAGCDAGRDLETTLRIWETTTAVKPFTPRGVGGLGLTSQNVEDAAHLGLTEIQKKGLAAFEQMSLSTNPRSNLPSKPKALRDGTVLPSATAAGQQLLKSHHQTAGHPPRPDSSHMKQVQPTAAARGYSDLYSSERMRADREAVLAAVRRGSPVVAPSPRKVYQTLPSVDAELHSKKYSTSPSRRGAESPPQAQTELSVLKSQVQELQIQLADPNHGQSQQSQQSPQQQPKHEQSRYSPQQQPKHGQSQQSRHSPQQQPKHGQSQQSQHSPQQQPKHGQSQQSRHSPQQQPEYGTLSVVEGTKGGQSQRSLETGDTQGQLVLLSHNSEAPESAAVVSQLRHEIRQAQYLAAEQQVEMEQLKFEREQNDLAVTERIALLEGKFFVADGHVAMQQAQIEQLQRELAEERKAGLEAIALAEERRAEQAAQQAQITKLKGELATAQQTAATLPLNRARQTVDEEFELCVQASMRELKELAATGPVGGEQHREVLSKLTLAQEASKISKKLGLQAKEHENAAKMFKSDLEALRQAASTTAAAQAEEIARLNGELHQVQSGGDTMRRETLSEMQQKIRAGILVNANAYRSPVVYNN